MKISVITVVYNGIEFIEETIQSVSGQDYVNVEYIVVDGNSNDGTIEIINRYSDNIDKIICEDDDGQTDALIKGIAASTGDYICWLNYDDLFLNSSSISDLVNDINNNPGYALYYGNDVLIDGAGKKIRKRIFNNIKLTNLLHTKSISQPASIFSREVFNKYGLNRHLDYSMDLDFFIKIFKNHDVFYLNRTFAKNRIHGARKMEAHFIDAVKEAMEVRKSHGLNQFKASFFRYLFQLKFWLKVNLKTRSMLR